MPKMRGIKPETWTDENFVELTPLARLLFIGLWTYACDNGHLEDKSKQIKMRLLPVDDCNAAELLRELAASGRIVREDGWITIPKFTEHQRIDKRWFVACDKPGCAKPGTESGDSQREPRGGHDEATTRPPRAHDVASQGPHEQVPDARDEVEVDCEVEGELKVSGTSTAVAVRDDHEPTAQSFVAEWIEHCEQRPPGRVIGHVAKELKTMLDEGIEPERVRRGLAEWNRRGLHPSTLASVVHETSERRSRPGSRNQETEDIFSRAAVRLGVLPGGQS